MATLVVSKKKGDTSLAKVLLRGAVISKPVRFMANGGRLRARALSADQQGKNGAAPASVNSSRERARVINSFGEANIPPVR